MSDDAKTPLDGDDFLAANRANRERIRAEAAAKSVDSSTADAGPTGPAELRGWLLPASAAVIVVLVVAVGVLGYLLATADDADALDRDGALRDAKSYAAEMFTYQTGRYDDLDRRIRAISTPAFADEYITSSQLARKANDEAKASSKGAATSAGIVSISDTEAVVLVALDMTVTSPEATALGQGNGPSQSRVEMTLTRDSDRWVVSDLDVV